MSNYIKMKQNIGAFSFYLRMLAGAIVCIYAGYQWGFHTTQEQLTKLKQNEQTIQNLHQENENLTRNLNVLGVELDVEKISSLNAQESIRQGLNREAELKKQLGFYQKVMAPELTVDGFTIDDFIFAPAASPRHYYFELVLVQVEKIKSVIKGNIQIQLIGSQNQQPTTLSFEELLKTPTKQLSFSFKYFQLIKGQFSLPEGFVPERIQIDTEIFQFKRKKGDYSRSFDWEESLTDTL